MKTILILGGGTGGIITAHELRKKVGNKVNIILFEKKENNVFAPSLLWLMVGKRKLQQVFRNTNKLRGNGIDIVLGDIEGIDPSTISVTVKGQEYKGDYMVVSLGADYATDLNIEQYGHNFYTLEGAASFYERLNTFKGGKIIVLVSSLPFKCPAAPYEAAMLIESYISNKGLKNKTTISLYTPEPQPMPVAGKELGQEVKTLIEQKGIHYSPEHQIAEVTESTLIFSNGKTVDYNLLAYTPKHVCPGVIRQSALMGKSNWIEVDRSTMETNFSNIYAIGDNTFIPLESGRPLPKAGVFAHHQAETVAHNIAQKLYGKADFKVFDGYGQCFLEMGNGTSGYASGNFYASPVPLIKMKNPSRWWHWTKVWFEKYWWFKYF